VSAERVDQGATRHRRGVSRIALARLLTLCTAVLLGTSCAAGGPLGLGGLDAARRARPDLFTRDCFARLGDRYVVCGSAERMFADESDEELRDEARMDAQARLGASLRASELEVAGFAPAHEWRMCGGRVVVSNYTVPVSAVAVTVPAAPGTPTLSRRKNQCSDD
jgi:hypothetical protein